MNEDLDVVQTLEPIAPALSPSSRPLSYWLRRFLACNPFYLVSAALLLYGFYRVSIDPNFLSRETAQLFFNFTSLQVYEVLLVLTAIFLARRRIWYDSTLLVGLENMLVLVPFILISQGALIDTRMVWTMCLAGGIVALARAGAVKRFIAELNFPARLGWIGLAMLLVNVALPVVYRILHEHKVGTKPTWGAAYLMNEYVWLLLLPALCGLANLLPPARRTGELLPQSRWLPPGLFSLWLAGTGVHLYCLGYVYDFSLRRELVAPAIWMLLWSLRQRAADFLPRLNPVWRRALLLPPLLATLLAASQPGNEVFLMLTILNVAAYGSICCYRHEDRLARHLLLISLVALVGGLPEDWGHHLAANFSRAKCLGAGAASYFLLWAALSRNPKLGLVGALVSACGIIGLLGESPGAFHWAAQIGLAFLLLHSLRWTDIEHAGAGALRWFAALLWVAHTFVWMRSGGAGWMACLVALPLLLGYLAARWFGECWGPKVVPIAAMLVMLAGPGDFTAGKLQATPVGLLAIIGSFLLFGLGTLAALTRHWWSGPDEE